MSSRPRCLSVCIARTRLIAPCHLRNAPANTAIVRPRSNGPSLAAAGRNRSTSAPHSISTIFRGGTHAGTIVAVRAKAPEDAAGFKRWLQDVAQKAAEAGTEGGFMGFGGVAVSDAEKATLAEISGALGAPAAQA